MKCTLTSIILLLGFFATAQISGTISNENNDPVEFATLFNISKETSSISNAEGIFKLEGDVGDSIRVQHLNYKSGEFIIDALNVSFVLTQKNYDLNEIVVSANYAALLFQTACKNTYNKLKDKNVSRGYFRSVRIENKDTVQIMDLDLDIVQRKQKSYDLKDRILPSKVQERIITDISSVSNLRLEMRLFPSFNGIDWSKFQNYYNYFKVEDSQFNKLYFFNKESFKDSITHIEVKILKTDSCLSSFSLVTQNPLKNRKGDILKMKTTSFINISYDYGSEFVCLNEISRGLILTGSGDGRKDVSIFQSFKTYNNGATNLETRSDGVRIFHNKLEPRLIKNRYNNEFWKSDSYLDEVPFDYEYLLNLRLGNED